MREGIIIFVIIISAFTGQSCSVYRQNATVDISEGREGRAGTVEGSCYENNISGEDLIIGRTRIEYQSEEQSRSISGFIKQNKEGNILFSFRSLAGIEIARALITSDSIKIYDRINKNLYVQSVDYLDTMYGLSREDISIIWGDFPAGLLMAVPRTDDKGTVELVKERKGTEYILRPDTEFDKLKSLTGKGENGRTIEIIFDRYISDKGLLYPGRSSININKGEIIIELNLGGVKREKIKNMKFVVPEDASIIVLR